MFLKLSMNCRIRSIKKIAASILIFGLVFDLVQVPARAMIVSRVRCDRKIAALTFDDGPHPEYTEEILDILKEYGVHATFFVVGSCAEEYPDIILREIEEGHEVENHTYSHLYFSRCGSSSIEDEIEKSESAINAIIQYRFNFIRPPGGIVTRSLEDALKDKPYDIVLWSLDTRDWTAPPASSIVRCVLDNITPGDIVLMHDFVSGRSSTPEALRTIIPSLLSEGYEFVRVSELISFSDSESDE